MQVISSTNQDHQQIILQNLFQKFIDIHSDDVESLSSNTKSANQNIKREWNYFKDLLNYSPINTNKITSYIHLLEQNQQQNNIDISPVNSHQNIPSFNSHEIASSKSPNTRIYAINQNDVPKNAFQKNCFKRGANTTSNRNYFTQNPSNFDLSSPQVLSSRESSNKQFSQAIQYLENTTSSSTSPSRSIPVQNQYSSTAGLSHFSKNLNINSNSPGNSQERQQASYQIQIPSKFSYNLMESNSQQQKYGTRIEEITITPIQIQQQVSQPFSQVPAYNKNIDKSQINTQSDIITTRNSQDLANNIPSFEINSTITNLAIKTNNLNLPSTNLVLTNQTLSVQNQNIPLNSLNSTSSTTSNPTSLQIENLKNQTQQFYKEYKSQQIDSLKSQQQQNENSKISTQTLQSIPTEFNRGLYNQYHQISSQHQHNHQQYSSLDHNKANQQIKIENIQHLRALSPSYQTNQYHMSSSQNRMNSPTGKLGQVGVTVSQQPANSNKNALNYKNKLLLAANQAVPLNQLSIVQTNQTIQPKSESFSGGFTSASNTNQNNNLFNAQTYQIQPTSNYGLQTNENQYLQRNQSPLITGISPRTQPAKIVGSTFSEQQQTIIDDMIRYQFKVKIIHQKTQLLETYMKNNSAALNQLISE